MPTFGTATCLTYGFGGTSGCGGAFFLCAKLAGDTARMAMATLRHIRSGTQLRQFGLTSIGEIVFGDIICGKTDPTPTDSYTYDAFRLGSVYANLNNLQAHGADVKNGQASHVASSRSRRSAPKALIP